MTLATLPSEFRTKSKRTEDGWSAFIKNTHAMDAEHKLMPYKNVERSKCAQFPIYLVDLAKTMELSTRNVYSRTASARTSTASDFSNSPVCFCRNRKCLEIQFAEHRRTHTQHTHVVLVQPVDRGLCDRNMRNWFQSSSAHSANQHFYLYLFNFFRPFESAVRANVVWRADGRAHIVYHAMEF